jgi:hypothetical protein
MRYYPLSSVQSAMQRYRRRVFIAVGVEIGRRWRRGSIFPNGHYVAMETALVPSMRREFVISVESLIPECQYNQ